ncbi:amidohydrolase family protein [Chitinasiproducens palmae]|uniref:Predicted metal-dependent hydrolase, TIM-barrel fold n=1 Tax=Chitinasiproducens palmae TaxID=1770053 RepID=A0A1H2PRG6_9BURK|nr:amidohydrolase family protein [Chitinasiproducens palmae]SDV48653.1 Predicted metal-dependent hydrolase, TIM-barrel fold [Chitinasiproducens palmae]
MKMSVASAPNEMPAHPPVRPDWLDRVHEEAVEPDLRIVDSHHHLWRKPDALYLSQDYVSDVARHNVVSSVFAECRTCYRSDGPEEFAPLGETAFVLEQSSHARTGHATRVAAAIIGYADLMRGSAAGDVLDEHMRVAGEAFRGIRNIAAWHPDARIKPSSIARPPEKLLYDATFRAGFQALAERGLTFDTYVLYGQLGDVRDLALAFPHASIVIDHTGGPMGLSTSDATVFSAWEAGLQDVARCQNVSIKIGGFGMPVMGAGFPGGSLPPTSDELARTIAPYVTRCIDLFGADRCMFESNFPVDKASYSYTVLWNAFKKLTAHLPDRARARLFGGTAEAVYGMS